jgi:hypothetical protein
MILRQKIIFFPIAEGGAKIVGVFRVKNHDFTPKKIIFFPILGKQNVKYIYGNQQIWMNYVQKYKQH